ncbi:MAG: guanylate kinase [Prolixibacteraceae bacterium]|nr:guanylate kinase [Prolixibacteraceae bacterium]
MAANKAIIFSAPSGSGKTTIVKHLLSLPLNLRFSISATSRAPRPDEIDGKDYYFVSRETFERKIEENAFVEWEEVYQGSFYGTYKSEVERIWGTGKTVIFDLDVVGGVNVKNKFAEQALAVFIMPPSIEALRQRLVARCTESEEKIDSRIAKAEYELSFTPEFDVILINDVLENTLAEAEEIVKDFLEK